jgi:hypothetical protein
VGFGKIPGVIETVLDDDKVIVVNFICSEIVRSTVTTSQIAPFYPAKQAKTRMLT